MTLEGLEEDFAELWDMWFGSKIVADFYGIRNKLREINHKYNLGLVEPT
tara:strand:- start:420 stop:566 length:147 start_codon:yes stop_codon:yes gene_type:complete